MESKRIQIGEHRYQLRPWSVADGDRWWFVLGNAFALVLPELKVKKDASGKFIVQTAELQLFGILAQSLGVETLLEFAAVCRNYTDLVGVDAQGRETVLPLSSDPFHLRGMQDVLTELMLAHGREQFGGPLSRLISKLGAAPAVAEKEK